MPIYEYQCQLCGHELEALQKISDGPLVDCPSCHNSSLQKLVSAASFRLKGSGWYETDFKQDGKKHLAESDSEKADTGSESEQQGTDSKQASENTQQKSGESGMGSVEKGGDKPSTADKSRGEKTLNSKGKSESTSDSKSPGKSGNKPA